MSYRVCTHHLVPLSCLEERVFVVAAQKPADRKQVCCEQQFDLEGSVSLLFCVVKRHRIEEDRRVVCLCLDLCSLLVLNWQV